jgi:hypothetical protein
LLEIANRCPVKRTLSSDIQINSELIEWFLFIEKAGMKVDKK